MRLSHPIVVILLVIIYISGYIFAYREYKKQAKLEISPYMWIHMFRVFALILSSLSWFSWCMFKLQKQADKISNYLSKEAKW